MKKRFLATLFCSMFLLGTSTTVAAQELTQEGDTYICIVSPDASQNTGKCRKDGLGRHSVTVLVRQVHLVLAP